MVIIIGAILECNEYCRNRSPLVVELRDMRHTKCMIMAGFRIPLIFCVWD